MDEKRLEEIRKYLESENFPLLRDKLDFDSAMFLLAALDAAIKRAEEAEEIIQHRLALPLAEMIGKKLAQTATEKWIPDLPPVKDLVEKLAAERDRLKAKDQEWNASYAALNKDRELVIKDRDRLRKILQECFSECDKAVEEIREEPKKNLPLWNLANEIYSPTNAEVAISPLGGSLKKKRCSKCGEVKEQAVETAEVEEPPAARAREEERP
jgi:hypothetical protein